ncbi:MAG: DEAD/DEAH box helicase [Paludibaculum sp.]
MAAIRWWCTPTASGKTLCYNLPVLHRLVADPGARALYLFPTKALAEDQLHEFH